MKKDAQKDTSSNNILPPPTDVIEISSNSEGSVPPPFVTPKAHKLIKLTKSVSDATDNRALSGVVAEFAAVLQGNKSRTLTREGFAFLDALYRRLADPSVLVQPMRTSRTRSSSDKEQMQELELRQAKLGVVARLRREVGEATGNRALARMVADFGAVTNRSNGRTVTKDGFAFLDGLAARLEVLR